MWSQPLTHRYSLVYAAHLPPLTTTTIVNSKPFSNVPSADARSGKITMITWKSCAGNLPGKWMTIIIIVLARSWCCGATRDAFWRYTSIRSTSNTNISCGTLSKCKVESTTTGWLWVVFVRYNAWKKKQNSLSNKHRKEKTDWCDKQSPLSDHDWDRKLAEHWTNREQCN